MKRRNLGNSGLAVSEVGLGCNNFGLGMDLEASRAVIDRAIGLGINLFDTADIYGNRGGSETIIGEVLGERRKDIILATKFSRPMDDEGRMGGTSRRYIMMAVEASLRRLRTDWIDLYQIHEPDQRTPIEETLRALDDLIRQGKVRYAGCSNFPAWQVVEAMWTSRELKIQSFISCQDEYSLLVRRIESDRIPVMQRYGLGLLPYFPLGSGLLTGKYRRNHSFPEGTRFASWKSMAPRYATERNWKMVEALQEFCAARNHTLLDLAFSWLLSKPVVSSVIAGATKPEQLDSNVASVNWELSPEDLAEVDKITGSVS
jgi:aryl-alcohol dehydrogenase-like predicted oxidoreductase